MRCTDFWEDLCHSHHPLQPRHTEEASFQAPRRRGVRVSQAAVLGN